MELGLILVNLQEYHVVDKVVGFLRASSNPNTPMWGHLPTNDASLTASVLFLYSREHGRLFAFLISSDFQYNYFCVSVIFFSGV